MVAPSLCKSAMAVQINPSSSTLIHKSADHRIATRDPQKNAILVHKVPELGKRRPGKFIVRCSEKQGQTSLRTCKICKAKFDPLLNHSRACRFHPAHFGGETKRKFESVYSGGTMNTPNSGKISEYWHCCGSEDIFHPGCTPTPHASYDD